MRNYANFAAISANEFCVKMVDLANRRMRSLAVNIPRLIKRGSSSAYGRYRRCNSVFILLLGCYARYINVESRRIFHYRDDSRL